MRARGIWLLAALLTLFFPFVISRATTASPDPSARDSFTSRACFAWNAIPYIIWALEQNGFEESRIDPQPGTWVGSRADT